MNKYLFNLLLTGRKSLKRVFGLRDFQGSTKYWIERYMDGGNSGDGSYEENAIFKAKILNQFVEDNKISSVIEYGCGDGNQLRNAKYPKYTGFDISPHCISQCRDIFLDDHEKIFLLMSEYSGETAQLVLSLDVIYHLVEDNIYEQYMERLFDSSEGFVIIYSTDTKKSKRGQAPHIYHRNFTKWVEINRPNWRLINSINNPKKGDNLDGVFLADFYIYSKESD